MKSEAMSFAATVNREGQLKLEAAERKMLDSFLRTIPGRPIELSVKVIRATRTAQANRYYWGVVVPLIAEHLGYQKDELHEALKQKFLRLDAEPDAHGLVRVRSTATMNTREFGDYLENVITWAGAEFGLNIPAPGEHAA